LIYQASNGYTPRNTSSLVSFGKTIPIAGLSPAGIASQLKPLDLIVWKGHVVIALGTETAIESTNPEGVIISDLRTRLSSIMKERTPVNNWKDKSDKSFVARRWYPERSSF